MRRWWASSEGLLGVGTLLDKVEGSPWGAVKVRRLVEEQASGNLEVFEENNNIRRLMTNKDGFVQHSFSEGCPGCQAIPPGTPRQDDSQVFRSQL